MLSLRSVVDFHDASLLILNGDGTVAEAWHCPKELRDRLESLKVRAPEHPRRSPSFPKARLPLFQLRRHERRLGALHQSSLELRHRDPLFPRAGPKNAKGVRSAVLVLYRRELVPFVERDYWLLEMTYGPLALALEKVVMLKAIGAASKNGAPPSMASPSPSR